MGKTIAVVVTFNREKLLQNCIEALRAQTRPLDAILVVNNGSTDNTEQWLLQQNDIHVISQPNLGSGGGFNTGIKWAFANGYQWIWCMDDDGFPSTNALEKLFEACPQHELTLLNCMVVDKDNPDKLVWKTMQYTRMSQIDKPLVYGKGHPFNGTLLSRQIIERVGLPNKKYFLWGDETEYLYRITRRNKIPVASVTASIHYHPATAFSLKQDWSFSSSWKMYYYVRNRLAVHKAKFGNPIVALSCYLGFIVAFAGVILFYQKTHRRQKLFFLAWPVADAFRRKYTDTPASILEGIKQKKYSNMRRLLNWSSWVRQEKPSPALG